MTSGIRFYNLIAWNIVNGGKAKSSQIQKQMKWFCYNYIHLLEEMFPSKVFRVVWDVTNCFYNIQRIQDGRIMTTNGVVVSNTENDSDIPIVYATSINIVSPPVPRPKKKKTQTKKNAEKFER